MTEFFLIGAIVIYLIGSLLLVRELQKEGKMGWHPYDTKFCRDTRAQHDMICPASRVEAMRKKVNSKKAKF